MNIINFANYRAILAILLATLGLSGVFAVESNPILVFDRTDSDWIVTKKFRANYGLNASASGQFSAQELEQLFDAVPVSKNHLWIIDLRQESHGFINGLPISWYATRNMANQNKTAKQILRIENNLLLGLRKQPSVEVFELQKADDGSVHGENPIQFTNAKIQSEQQLVEILGARYKRLYVLDHHKPDDQTVDDFIIFIQQKVKPQDWLHFHCRGGKGRSSTFIAMYDMILNANDSSFEEIIKRQVEMGNINFDRETGKLGKTWKFDASAERYNFLKKFYAYVIDTKGYKVQTWSKWLQQQAIHNE